MKIDFIDDVNIIIYLNKMYVKSINFDSKEELEEYFKEIFLKLKKFYHITICGYYCIDVYVDKIYGAILEINKEELEFFDYFDNQVDMRITVHDVDFIYEMENLFVFDKTSYDTYFYNNKWYIKIKNSNYSKIGELLEYSKIYYQDDVDIILKKGKLIDT